MPSKTTNEFNASSVMTPKMALRLYSLALQGSGAVMSVFTAVADARGLTERGRMALERRAEQWATIRRMALATQERIAEFQHRLDRLERASYEALLEADEVRRSARKELEQLRERAYEVTMADGRVVKVYRDGDTVRDDNGAVVSRDSIRAEDIPGTFPTWQERQARGRAFEDAERQHREIVEYRERLARARNEAGEEGIASRRMDELESDIENMPDSVRNRLDGEARPPERKTEREITPPGQGASMPGPG